MSIGTLPSFDPKHQEWEIFCNRVNHFLNLNDIQTEEKKHAVLVTHLSDGAYLLLRNLCHPKEVETLKFDELVEILNKHLTPTRATFADLGKFYNAVQAEEESVEDWAARLRGLAVHCAFGASLDRVYRDKFVLGLNMGAVRDKLCEQDANKLTFAKALEIAKQTVVAKEVRGIAPCTAIKEEPLLWSGTGRPDAVPRRQDFRERCAVCGMKGHEAQRCRYKNYRCQRCQAKGHLKKMCGAKIKTVKNINLEEGSSSDEAQAAVDCHNCKECQLFNLRCVDNEPYLISIIVNGRATLKMEIDSGSSTNVISKELYLTHFTDKQIFNCNVKMCFYNGHKIKPLGYFTTDVTYNGLTHEIKFFVIENGGPPLLGRDFMAKFKLCISSSNNKIVLTQPVGGLEIQNLINKYKELFSTDLGCYTRAVVTLQLKEGAKPKFCKARPLPFAIKNEVEAELERLVKVGILEPVNHSDYATPIVPVRKSNGSVRICADYSVTLNKDIYQYKYPLPRIEEIFAKLSNGRQYSKLDCSQAYNQLRLSEESQKLTTINTTKGLFKYKRLVFGLACAPAIFQRTIENLLGGIEGVTVFLDDVCVTGPTKAVHLERLEKVFQRFKESGFRLEKSKCSFFQDSVTYLGHIISKDGLQKSPKKVEAIVKVPKPTNVTELKRFLGMANYYRNFVPNASSILAPLHELLREGTPWEWAERHQVVFERMKRELSSERVLAHFDPAAQLVLTVDAGPDGLGAVLATIDAAGRERPLAFGSRSLLQSERNYSQLQKEATAIVFGVKRFHQYLYGRRDPFILKTDHKPLLAIFGRKGGISVTTASRLVRYAVFLSAYNYKIQYTAGKENHVADFFSRAPLTQRDPNPHEDSELWSPALRSLQLVGLPVTYKDIREATANDSILKTVIKYVNHGWPRKINCKNVSRYSLCKTDLEVENGCLLRGHRVVIPTVHRNSILQELHRTHQGVVRTKSAARSRVWWPGIDHDIERIVGECPVCVALRPAPPRELPQPWPRPTAPWLRIHLDYMSVSQGTYLVVIDAFSKWLECFDMSCGTATKHLILILKFLFSRFGLPETIVSDNDAKISSQEFIEFCKTNGISYITSPIYHPCSNGQAENSVRTCKRMIKAILETYSCKYKINEKLQEYLFEYRNTPHCVTGVSPARLMIGRELRGRLDLVMPPRHKDSISVNETKRLFNIGELVWCRCYIDRKPIWKEGTITEKVGSRMFLVELAENNEICKRHIDQLVRKKSNNVPPVDSISTKPNVGGSQPVLSTPFQLIEEEELGGEWQDASEEAEREEQIETAGQQEMAEKALEAVDLPVAPPADIRVYGSPLPSDRVLRPKKEN